MTERQDSRSAAAAIWRPWYKSARWQRIRAKQLRDEPLCRMCAAQGRVTPATVCDHVDPHKGDPVKFWCGPYQSLCDNHHSSDKQRIERGGKARPTITEDGWPIEV